MITTIIATLAVIYDSLVTAMPGAQGPQLAHKRLSICNVPYVAQDSRRAHAHCANVRPRRYPQSTWPGCIQVRSPSSKRPAGLPRSRPSLHGVSLVLRNGGGSGVLRHAQAEQQEAVDGGGHDAAGNHGAPTVQQLAAHVVGDGLHGQEGVGHLDVEQGGHGEQAQEGQAGLGEGAGSQGAGQAEDQGSLQAHNEPEGQVDGRGREMTRSGKRSKSVG